MCNSWKVVHNVTDSVSARRSGIWVSRSLALSIYSISSYRVFFLNLFRLLCAETEIKYIKIRHFQLDTRRELVHVKLHTTYLFPNYSWPWSALYLAFQARAAPFAWFHIGQGLAESGRLKSVSEVPVSAWNCFMISSYTSTGCKHIVCEWREVDKKCGQPHAYRISSERKTKSIL